MKEIFPFTKKGAAKYLGVSEKTIQRRVKDGSLPERKIASKLRFNKSELDKLVHTGFGTEVFVYAVCFVAVVAVILYFIFS